MQKYLLIIISLLGTFAASAQIPSENLILWLSADSVEIIDNKVATWYDKSGNEFHLTQNDPARRPIKIDSVLNNLPGIQFNGSNNFMQVSFGQDFEQPNTFFVIWNITASSGIRYLFSGSSATNSNSLFWRHSNDIRIHAGGFCPIYEKTIPFDFILSTAVFNGNQSNVFENSYYQNTCNPGNGFVFDLKMGCAYINSQFYMGEILEFIFINDILDSITQRNVEYFLMQKYSPQFNLGEDIIIAYGFCETTLSIPFNFYDILWSTGDTSHSIIINETGQYFVQARDSIFGRLCYDTVFVQFPDLPSLSDSHICLGDSAKFSVNMGSDYSYLWSTGSTQDTIYISEAGDYWLEISDTLGCSRTIEFSVSVDSFPNQIALPPDTAFCAGNSISLAEGAELAESFLWSPGEQTSPAILVFDPGWYYITATNQNNCVATDSIYIDITGIAPTPLFEINNLCIGDTTQITDLSQHPDSIASHTWIFNDIDTLFTQNPQYIFADTGQHNIELILESYSGCIKDTIAYLNILPVAEISIEHLPLCSNIEAEFFPQISLPPNNEIISYNWYIDNNPISNNETLTYTFPETGEYNLQLDIIIDNGCLTSYQTILNIPDEYPLPENLSLIYPKNNIIKSDSTINFQWNIADNAIYYQLIIAEDSLFNELIFSSEFISQQDYVYTFLHPYDTVFWKAIAYNPCLQTAESEFYSIINFNPLMLDNLQLWLDADSVLLADGNQVAVWYDKSGNIRNIAQPDNTKRPVRIDSVLNNKPAIRFNGNTSFMESNHSEVFEQPNTFFIIWDVKDSLTNNYAFSGFSVDYSNSLFWRNSNEIRVHSGNNYTFVYDKTAPFNHLLSSVVFNSNQSKVFENTILKNTVNAGSAPLANIKIGAAFNNTAFLKGDILELLFIDTLINDSLRSLVEKYLIDKYSGRVNLGPDIRITYGFCDTTITTAAKPWFTDYLWSTGETDSIITVNKPGIYSVTVTDIFGFESTDQIRVFYPHVKELTDTTLCLGSPLLWDTELEGEYSFSWLGSDSELAFAEFPDPGAYAFMVEDTAGCIYHSDTINLTHDLYELNASLGPADTLLCAGNRIFLMQNAEETVNWLWNTGETNPEIVLQNTGTYSLTSQNWRGCNAHNEINVTIVGSAPTPDYYIENLCIGDSTLFVDNSIPSDEIDFCTWILNDLDTINNHSFFWHFDNVGVQNIELIVTANNGCSNSISFEIEILETPNVSFSNAAICQSVLVDFYPEVTIPEGTEILSYNWIIDGLFASNDSILSYTFEQESLVEVSLEVELSNNCSAKEVKLVDIYSDYPLPENLSLIYPSQNQNISSPNVILKWNSSTNSLFYSILIATDSTFQDIILYDYGIFENSYSYSLLQNTDTLFWRVFSFNPCLDSIESEIRSFTRFSPDKIESAIIWFNADHLVADENDNVSTIINLIDGEPNATQSNVTRQPKVVYNAINSYPILRFDGVNDYLQLLFPEPVIQPYSAIVLWQAKGLSLNQFAFDGSEASNRAGLSATSTQIRLQAGSTLTYNNTLPFDNYLLSTAIVNSANSMIFANRSLMNTGNAGDHNLIGLIVGSAYNLTSPLNGDIAEIIFYDTVLNDTDRQMVERYLHHKYFPPVNLGPDIRITYGFCDTTITTAAKPWFTDYLWSTGETDSVITVNKPGIYSVTVTDIFGFESTDQIRVFYPRVKELTDTTLCLGSPLLWDTELEGEYSFAWLGSDSELAFAEFPDPGAYAFMVEDTAGCIYYSDTISFIHDLYELNASLGPADTLLCAGNRIFLMQNAEETVNWLWNTGETNPEIVLQNTGTYSLTSQNWRGCEAYNEINVTIEGTVPEPNFSTQGHCAKNTTFFNDLSVAPEGEIIDWKWTIDGELLSSQQNTETIINEPGNYNITLEVTTTENCSDFIDIPLTIQPLPQPDFLPNRFCQNNEIDFIANSQISSGEVNSHTWEINQETFTTNNPQYIFDNHGFYDIKLIAESDMNCVDSIIRTIEILPANIPDFSVSPACLGNPVYFINNTHTETYNPVLNWKWDFGDENTSELSNPQHIYTQPGEFDISLTAKFINGCSTDYQKSLTVYATPKAEIADFNACINQLWIPQDQSTSADGEITARNWQIGENNYSGIPEIIFQDTGTYNLKYEVISDFECTDILDTMLTVHPKSFAQFKKSPSWGSIPLNVEFTDQSQNAASWHWIFDDGEESFQQNPAHQFTDSGYYNIKMISYSEYDCADTAYAQIRAIIPIMDIMVFDMNAEIVDNYINTSVYIINKGTLPASDIDMILTTGAGNVIKEQIDYLDAGQVKHYKFSTNIYRPSGKLPELICIEAKVPPYDTHYDIDLSNNTICKSTLENLKTFPPYPNPAKDEINIEFFTPNSSDIVITLTNSTGSTISTINLLSHKGYKHITLPTTTLPSGLYYITITSPTTSNSYKIVINNKQ